MNIMNRYFYKYNSPFELECGEKLEQLEICYHITDNFTTDKKVIWICHALTANSNPEEWWPNFVGKGKLFDTDKYSVICANILGSCYGSTGPASFDQNGNQYLLSFPNITVRDIVRAHDILREHLGIRHIDIVIGGSIGGFQALEWSIMFPEKIDGMVLLACNAKVSPWGTAFNETQRMALFSDPSFEEQNSIDGGAKGLETARAIALLSYRSYKGYKLTQSEEDCDKLFAEKACSYQKYQGKKLKDRFNAYSYYTLTKSIDSHNVGRERGGVEKALSQIKAHTLIIGIDSDVLFPLEEQKFLAENIPNSQFEIISSDFGHDGFLLEWKSITTAIKKHIKIIQ
jgi:homoserine O-acetyltransferase